MLSQLKDMHGVVTEEWTHYLQDVCTLARELLCKWDEECVRVCSACLWVHFCMNILHSITIIRWNIWLKRIERTTLFNL